MACGLHGHRAVSLPSSTCTSIEPVATVAIEARRHAPHATHAALDIDAPREVERIAAALYEQVICRLKRRGVVIGISGGVDSAVVAALAVRALGSERVLGLLLPERDRSEDSLRLGRTVASAFGLVPVVEDITSTLEATGCYRRQADAIRSHFPDYGPGYKCKLLARLGTREHFASDDSSTERPTEVRAHDGRELSHVGRYELCDANLTI
jgi:asparagine synthetase B (glutamine-hydrolysing)